jgi:hypothetical protein
MNGAGKCKLQSAKFKMGKLSFHKIITPQLWLQRHTGPGGRLFTRSDSVADPLSAERPPAIAKVKNHRWNFARRLLNYVK